MTLVDTLESHAQALEQSAKEAKAEGTSSSLLDAYRFMIRAEAYRDVVNILKRAEQRKTIGDSFVD